MEKEIRLSNRGFASSQKSLNQEISWLYQILPYLEMSTSHNRELEKQGTYLLQSLMKTQRAVEDFKFKLNSVLYNLLQEVEAASQESQISFEASQLTSLF